MIFKNGFFIDGLIQYSTFYLHNYPVLYQGGAAGIRVGNKWYFGNWRNYRLGINVIWGRTNLILITDNYSLYPFLMVAPLNIGWTNTFSFTEDMGLELNINLGFNLIVGYDFNAGYLINPVLKFRYNSFAVGLDIAIINGNTLNAQNHSLFTLVGLTVGGKF